MEEILSTATPTLKEDQIEVLMRYGETRETHAGQVLSRAGDDYDFIVVLEGALEVVDDFAGQARTIVIQRAGGFVGDLNLLTGQAQYVSVMVHEGGEVLAIPPERLKEVVTEEANLSDIILKAFLARRSWEMRNGGTGLRLVGSRHSMDTARLREFAARNRLPHVWIELEDDPNAEALLERFGAKPSETPVAIWQSKAALKNPTNAELAQVIGLAVDAPRKQTYDLVVIGTGPAGLGAAVYGASEGLATLALESIALGGQAGTSSRIENYLGFPVGLSGFELASRALIQANKFGARTAVPLEAVGLRRGEDGHYRIGLSEGGEVVARSVIAATGARYRRLEVPRLERFEGVSVHHAATEAEAQRCEGEEVAVVGGGNSAGQAALFLAGRTRRVYLLIRGDDLGKGMSRYLVDRITDARNVELLADTEVRELLGEDRLDGVVVEDNRSGARRTLGVRALFVFIGAEANTGWLQGAVELDERGFVLTGRELDGSVLDDDWQERSREPFLLETSMPGVFAAGDVRSGSIKRCASAVGEGAMAVRFVHQYLADAGAQRA